MQVMRFNLVMLVIGQRFADLQLAAGAVLRAISTDQWQHRARLTDADLLPPDREETVDPVTPGLLPPRPHRKKTRADSESIALIVLHLASISGNFGKLPNKHVCGG